MEEATGHPYQDTVEVRSVLGVMAERVGMGPIAARVQTPLQGLKVACYYGCLLTHPPEIAGVSHHEYPMNMDRAREADRCRGSLGSTPRWSRRRIRCVKS